jgi:ketosteroid isomerase-like protein
MKAVVAILAALVCLGALFWFYTAPKAPVEMTQAEIAQIEAEVREEIITIADAINDGYMRGDAEPLLSAYASDVRIYWTGMNVTREGFEERMVEGFQTEKWTEVEYKLIELFVHGDAAYTIGEWSGTLQVEGQEPVSVVWNCFSRFEKEDGVWKDEAEVCGPRDTPPEG